MEEKSLTTAKTLPIYSPVRKLIYCTDDMMNEMSKDRKHSLGQKIFNLSLDLLGYVARANSNEEQRVPILLQFVDTYDVICALCKMCVEKNYITEKRYLELMPILASIGKQCKGWLKKSLAEKSKQNQD